ncbi:polyprenyl synthetase family protein [Fimbriimonas ginsengisoli]|uniref:Polyprenyl synthetase n=1 Tax=Fimbriimonas ginsengisoli Gsoil 348 TaxID=661478 RepID=A0A068NRR4_FIMGI|nr:farnesyl diphosphate synthase [Fimbriimonas ginsengisoli]AIE85455.1 polyprenyl synthetase [Fimbriimonas ginsengisoli Gsoil 348]
MYDVIWTAHGVVIPLSGGEYVIGRSNQLIDWSSLVCEAKTQKGTDDRHNDASYQRVHPGNGKIALVGFPLQLKAHAERVDARLRELLPPEDRVPSELHEAMRYACLAPGKRLRPALAMASAEAIGQDPGLALDAGCAIEMTHAFSLVHDDLPAIDNDELRRGMPTCWKRFGEAVALLAGDALFALAFDTLGRLSIEPNRIVAAVLSLTTASGSSGLVAGETVDILSEGKPIEPDTLAMIHALKTGALIAASCEIGVIVSGGSASEAAALRAYGEDVGLAFQIADDVLNETSTAEQLGKAAGSDRARQKATYPALYGLDESRRRAREAAERGIGRLANLPNRQYLEELARFSVERLS